MEEHNTSNKSPTGQKVAQSNLNHPTASWEQESYNSQNHTIEVGSTTVEFEESSTIFTRRIRHDKSEEKTTNTGASLSSKA